MGLMSSLFGMVFGGNRNVIKETAEVFRPNAEAGAQRSADLQAQVLAQYAAEFASQRRGLFDRFIDGVNRLPRPAMAMGVLGLLVAAMTDPVWFASRMQGLALVPDPLWLLLGAIVTFYFGGRWQAKGQDFQRGIAATMARVPRVVENIELLRDERPEDPKVATTGSDSDLEIKTLEPTGNQAVDEWRAEQQRS